MIRYWDIKSLIFYIILGFVAMLSLYKVKKFEYKTGQKQSVINKYYFLWFTVWVIAAVFRYVAIGFGGTDAISYKEFFEACLIPNLDTGYARHLDIGFQIFSKIIRRYTADYRIFFFIVYGIISFSYIFFLNELAFRNMSFIPIILVFYIYLRGFASIRTNISVAFLLISLVMLYKNKKLIMLVFAILSVLMHKASIFYAVFCIFYLVFKKYKITIKKGILLTVLAAVLAKICQNIILNSFLTDMLETSYVNYASRSLNSSFFEDSWKMFFEQIVLAFAILGTYKYVIKDVNNMCEEDKLRYKFIWNMCIFDIALIPVCYILHIWRGYEYFYIARLILWGEIIKVVRRLFKKEDRYILSTFLMLTFIAWMSFRIYSYWDMSSLTPYIFAPFVEGF